MLKVRKPQMHEVTGGNGHVQELAMLSDLRDSGDLSDTEFARAKEKLLR